ncbi:MAG: hypothetical protein LBI98_02700 [Endomicrobium sp.]|jgi:phosphoribosylformylglycinamidine synthase|nr:hypothetical protein [Endomicrobium sp.]
MFEIEILTKKGFKNSRGEHVLSDICGLGIENVTKVEYSSLYIIDGDISFAETETIASDLLTDKITENYVIRQRDAECLSEVISKFSDVKEADMINPNFSVIEVWYKDGVTDIVSESLIKAVKDLGIAKEIKAKAGHKYYLYGEIFRVTLDTIATKLLANVLIQECKVY